MTSRIFLLVGLGGFLGSVSRYLTADIFTKWLPFSFPFGTFAANIIGCFIIGLAYGLSGRFGWFSPEWRLFIATGFCGGYTTFSSFAYENLKLLQEGNYLIFGAYAISSFAIGMLAAFIGLSLTKI